MSRWDRRHLYWRPKEVIGIWIVGRIALIQDEWVRYKFGWYAKSIPRMLRKQDGKDDIGKGLYWWEVDNDGGCFWSQVKYGKALFHLECLSLMLCRQCCSLFQFHSYILVLLCRQRCFLFQLHSSIIFRQFKFRQSCFHLECLGLLVYIQRYSLFNFTVLFWCSCAGNTVFCFNFTVLFWSGNIKSGKAVFRWNDYFYCCADR